MTKSQHLPCTGTLPKKEYRKIKTVKEKTPSPLPHLSSFRLITISLPLRFPTHIIFHARFSVTVTFHLLDSQGVSGVLKGREKKAQNKICKVDTREIDLSWCNSLGGSGGGLGENGFYMIFHRILHDYELL